MRAAIVRQWARSLVILALGAAGLLFGKQPNFKPGFNLFSPKQDVEVGRENAAQVEKQLPILRDGVVERYVNELGRRLSTYAPDNRSEYAWQFSVVNSAD